VLLSVVVTLAVLIVALGVGFEPVYTTAQAGAEAALDRSGYTDAVLGVEA